jgi:hypothetical protein
MMNHLAAEGRRGALGDLARISQRPEAYRMAVYGTKRTFSKRTLLRYSRHVGLSNVGCGAKARRYLYLH